MCCWMVPIEVGICNWMILISELHNDGMSRLRDRIDSNNDSTKAGIRIQKALSRKHSRVQRLLRVVGNQLWQIPVSFGEFDG
jgi:hypothetical protein